MKILALIVALLISGCATSSKTPPIVYETIEVEVPVYQAPEFDIPEIPSLPVDDLSWSNKNDHDAIAKAYVISIKELRTHVEALHNLLEGIKKGDTQ